MCLRARCANVWENRFVSLDWHEQVECHVVRGRAMVPVSSQDITVPALPVVESTVVLVVAGRIVQTQTKNNQISSVLRFFRKIYSTVQLYLYCNSVQANYSRPRLNTKVNFAN
jgi:hypothetical protein